MQSLSMTSSVQYTSALMTPLDRRAAPDRARRQPQRARLHAMAGSLCTLVRRGQQCCGSHISSGRAMTCWACKRLGVPWRRKVAARALRVQRSILPTPALILTSSKLSAQGGGGARAACAALYPANPSPNPNSFMCLRREVAARALRVLRRVAAAHADFLKLGFLDGLAVAAGFHARLRAAYPASAGAYAGEWACCCCGILLELKHIGVLPGHAHIRSCTSLEPYCVARALSCGAHESVLQQH